MSRLVFNGLLIFAISVTCLDVHLSYKYEDTLYEFERNPVGLYLIELDGGNINLFMIIRTTSALIASISVRLLYQFKQKTAFVLLSVWTIQQTVLLYFLTLV